MTEYIKETAVVPAGRQEQLINSPFSTIEGFEAAQRMAKCLAEARLVPDAFRKSVPDCMIALELAARLQYSPFLIMQELYIVHGRPAFSSKFMIAALKKSGEFSPLKYIFRTDKNGAKVACKVQAQHLQSGELLEGTEVTLEMARAEGWSTKAGSKWQTMPEQMLRYRAASFFARTYAPDLLMGLETAEEVRDEATETRPTLPGPGRGQQSMTERLNALYDAHKKKPQETAPAVIAEIAGEPGEADAASPEAGETQPVGKADKPAAQSAPVSARNRGTSANLSEVHPAPDTALSRPVERETFDV